MGVQSRFGLSLPIIFAILVGWCFPAPTRAPAQPPAELSAATNQLVREIAAASTPNQAGRLYSKLFKAVNQAGLAELKKCPETGVALRATWEEAVGNRNGDEIEPMAMAKFLGFVKGRLEIDLPDWLEQFALKAHVRSDGMALLGFQDLMTLEKWPDDLPELVEIKESDDRVRIRLENQSLLAGREILDLQEWARSQAHSKTAGLMDQNECFLAFHSNSGQTYPLVCLDRRTGEIRWKSTVWAGDCECVVLGKPLEIVTLVAKGNQLFVIGAGSPHFYIECFHRQTGKPHFRFVNWYCSEVYPRPPKRF
jgi:hypothetical protein